MTYLQPTYVTRPDYSRTLGPEVGQMCAEAGFAPDEGQQMILDDTFAIDADGNPSAFEVAVVAPRQNIKTGVQKQIALGKMFVLERKLVIWSAHEYSTSAEAFRDMRDIVEATPWLDRQVKRVIAADGRETIETATGRLKFKARTKAGGRGLSGDDTFLDEAFALQPSHLGSLLPTMLTRPHAQVVYGSSAGLAHSAVLRSIRDRGRRGDPRLAYYEWGDPKPDEGCQAEACDHGLTMGGCALDDRRRWWQTNPALGLRITEESIANLRRSLPPEEFAREVLGWWDEPAGAGAELSLDAWQLLSDLHVDVRALPNIVLGVDVTPGHSAASIVACALDEQRGVPVVELVDRHPGASWLIERLPELVAKYRPRVVLNSTGPAGALIPDLQSLGIAFDEVRGPDYTRACARLSAAVNERSLRHRGEPEFTTAIAGAKARKNGDGFTWSRTDSSVDISPLVGATVALWSVASERVPLSDSELLQTFH